MLKQKSTKQRDWAYINEEYWEVLFFIYILDELTKERLDLEWVDWQQQNPP